MKKVLSVLAALLLAGTAFGVTNSPNDKANWGVAAIRQGGDLDLNGGITCSGTVTSAGSIVSSLAASSLVVSNGTNTGVAYITIVSDRDDDAGDMFRFLVPATGGLDIQSDGAGRLTNATVVTIAADGAITSESDLTARDDIFANGGAITVTAAPNATATASVIAGTNQDARIILDADAGADNADTWTIESEAADNDLSFVNHTTEAMKITSAGAVTVTDDLTCDKIIFTDAGLAAPTNSATAGFLITVNGTNYWLALYPQND